MQLWTGKSGERLQSVALVPLDEHRVKVLGVLGSQKVGTFETLLAFLGHIPLADPRLI